MSVKRKDNKGRILREGEIQKADGRYEFRYYDATGERRSLYSWRLSETDVVPEGKRPCSSLRELEKQAMRDVQDGIVSTKITLDECWRNYISNKPELKQTTRYGYCYMYDKYVKDEIGSKAIASINYSVAKRFFNHLVNDVGLKPNSIDNVHTILHPVFSTAVRDGIIRTNPINGIMADLKKSYNWRQTKKHGLTEEQQRTFIKYVEANDIYKALFICLLGTGCRIGEMLGLRWQDVSWDDNVISINHSLLYGMQLDGKTGFHISTPKTRNSVRLIPMFSSVRKALMDEYKKQSESGFCKDVVDGYSGFIFCGRNRSVLAPQNVNRAIKIICSKCGLPRFSAHQLRHTFCTRLCERETDLKLIQEIMGHADISTTMDVYNESNLFRKKASFARLEASDIF